MIQTNDRVASHLEEIAKLLELTEDEINSHKTFGYRKAADAIRLFPIDIKGMNPSTIKGIGPSIQKTILEFLESNTSTKYQELIRLVPPPSVMELTKIEGIGLPQAKILFQSYHVTNAEDLGKRINEGLIRDSKIIESYHYYIKATQRILYQDAFKIAGPIVEGLSRHRSVQQVSFVGSMRRSTPTVHNVNILCITSDRNEVTKYFLSWNEKENEGVEVLQNVKITIKGIVIHLEFCEEAQWGAKLLYLTGPKEFNIKNATVAKTKACSLTDYGLALPTGKVLGAQEKDIFERLLIPNHPPELRELASVVTLPSIEILSRKDIKGDAHIHTSCSENSSGSVINYFKAAQELGYKYLVFTDFEPELDLLQKQMQEIDQLNKENSVKLLKGIEVDISVAGTFIPPLDVYKFKFDFVVAGIHADFDKPKSIQTARLIEAIRLKPNVLVHPTCEEYPKRGMIDADWDLIFEECSINNVALEISGAPTKTGPDPTWYWRAKKAGVKFVLSSDAHSITSLRDISYALIRAQRGGIEKKDLLEVS